MTPSIWLRSLRLVAIIACGLAFLLPIWWTLVTALRPQGEAFRYLSLSVWSFLPNDPTFANSLTRTQQVLSCQFTDPISGHAVVLQMSKAQLKDPKVLGDKAWQEISANFTAMSNTTDAVAGGYSPIVSKVGNAQVASY